MKKIAIIDDDEETRETAAIDVDDMGLEPVLIVGEGLSIDDIIQQIQAEKVDAIISDHRLSPGNLSNFTGAEILSKLYTLKFPSLLVTQFLDIEGDVGIRKYRDKLPSVIGRGDQSPELIVKLLEASKYEIEKGRPVHRQPHRAIIRVEKFSNEDDCDVIDGVITTWSNDTAVRFPVDSLSAEIKSEIQSEIKGNKKPRLMAFVNTGGNTAQELFVTDIHLAPDVKEMTLDDFC
ncbi:MAG: hypothetical protein OQK69_03850 [Gammaproteobacteria bacterium]|nr:hypothetical protein [Gammaproteobacteria bacterium]